MQGRSKSSYAIDAVKRLIRFIWRFICSNITAFDPLRRRQVRIAAKRLIHTKAWAGDDATSEEIARVALLRVLFLQRETRRAVRHAEREAAAMLARASIEATSADCSATTFLRQKSSSMEKLLSEQSDS